MPGHDGKALGNMSLSNLAVPLHEAPHVAGSRTGGSNRRTPMSEESRRLAESIVTSLRGLGLECELIDLADQTH